MLLRFFAMATGFALLLPRAGAAGPEIAPETSTLTIPDERVLDLSGLTWIAGNRFAAVSDKARVVQYLTLQIDPATGRLEGGALAERLPVPVKTSDFEAVAWVEEEKRFVIAAEATNSVLSFSPKGGSVRTLPVPKVYRGARQNLGLESLTYEKGRRQYWLANEEALRADGAVSDGKTGSLVRLQQLDAKFRPLAQYAWRTEPASFRYGNAGSGVSDLCLLPNGQLLVLERGFAGFGLQLRLYLADFAGATDTTKLPALDGVEIVLVQKRLLYSQFTASTNFEGMAFGPSLAGGWCSLVFVADSNGTARHTFLALRIRF